MSAVPARAAALAGGLAERLRTLLLTLDRLDRLETAGEFAGWLGREHQAGRLAAPARELLLRALRVLGDPVNYRLVAALDPLEACELGELMRLAGLERVAASERINDLVQVGLAVRELIGDQIRGTELASGLVALVEEVSEATGEVIGAELGGREAGHG